MIGWQDIYKVVVAMAPLYVALILGYSSVKWWRLFNSDHCDAINRFVYYFTLPLFAFEFTINVDPFKMNYLFMAADAISKVLIVLVLAIWAKCSSKGSYGWSITSFSLSNLTNSLVVGVPLLRAMYGQTGVDLVVQSSVFQAIVWLTMLLFVLEIRRTRNEFSCETCDGGENGNTKSVGGNLEDRNDVVITSQDDPSRPSFWTLTKVVGMKMAVNPNSYACIIGITWAFLSKR